VGQLLLPGQPEQSRDAFPFSLELPPGIEGCVVGGSRAR